MAVPDFSIVLTSGFLVAVMPAGFALITAGLSRKKNAGHVVMLNLAAYVAIWLAFATVGFSVDLGHGFLLRGVVADPHLAAVALFRGAAFTTAGLILVGAICERITFWAFVTAEVFLGGLLAPAMGRWIWEAGWLAQLGAHGLGRGYVDFAGSTVIHATGGFCALALAMVLGPRIGKFGRRGESRAFPAHNVVYVAVGTLLLVSGWMGLHAGTAFGTASTRAALVAINTNVAAAAGSAAAMVFWYIAYGVPDITMACSGLIAGVVAIAAPCAYVGPGASIVIGAMAGVLASAGVVFNDRVLRIDDPCGVVAVHGYCGWFGAVTVGLFADGSLGQVTGLFHGGGTQFLVQIGGATLCALVAFGATYVAFKLLSGFRVLRVAPEIELEGLDLPEFGAIAYPDENAPAG